MRRPLALLLAGTPSGLRKQGVKLPILCSPPEGGDLRLSVKQDGAGRETRVAHRNLAVRQRGHLDALTVRIAVPALEPFNVSELGGEHAVVGNGHVYPL